VNDATYDSSLMLGHVRRQAISVAVLIVGSVLIVALARALKRPNAGDERGPAKQPPWVKQGPRIDS
jgi:hypothetical protein